MPAGSPVKESSFLNRETSAEDIEATAGSEEQQQGPQQQQPPNVPEATAAAASGEQQDLPVRR
jgi:hypothetical protein